MMEEIMIDGISRPTRNSNGQLIHPTLQGIENFWRWFGDSKVVDAEGKPLVVYHGTSDSFDTFEINRAGRIDYGIYGEGFYFTSDTENASTYAENSIDAPNVMLIYLKISKPYEKFDSVSGYNRKQSASLSQKIMRKGCDGRIFSPNGRFLWFVTLNSEQIKSAIGNNGDFKINNPSIIC